MKRLVALAYFFLSASLPALAQAQFSIMPDCIWGFNLNTTGPSTAFVNTQGCVTWTLVYNSTGFSALSLVFQSAPGIPGGTAGSYVTYPGTVESGSNPNTNTAGAVSTFSNGAVSTPFLRVDLASISGTGFLQGVFYGWRTGSGGGGGGGGGGGCVGTTSTPCVVAGWNGTTAEILKTDGQGRLLPGAFPSSATISVTSSGLTQIIAASGSTVITLGSYSVSFASAVDFQLEYGTGSNCGTGTTPLTGVYKAILTIAVDNPIFVPSGNALCVNLGSSVVGGGLAMYNQQ
jgi:hypothetical protein